jgi:hypothetical protein
MGLAGIKTGAHTMVDSYASSLEKSLEFLKIANGWLIWAKRKTVHDNKSILGVYVNLLDGLIRDVGHQLKLHVDMEEFHANITDDTDVKIKD